MKTLLIMRHAKSSWYGDARSDHDRPLNPRGIRDAPRIAKHLQEQGWLPELVISSTAQRTIETWQGMQKVLPQPIPVIYTQELYHAGLKQIQAQICALKTPPDTILVLGHNPGWEEAASGLTDLYIDMTTANVVILTHAGTTWADCFVHADQWEFVTHLRPKELR